MGLRVLCAFQDVLSTSQFRALIKAQSGKILLTLHSLAYSLQRKKKKGIIAPLNYTNIITSVKNIAAAKMRLRRVLDSRNLWLKDRLILRYLKWVLESNPSWYLALEPSSTNTVLSSTKKDGNPDFSTKWEVPSLHSGVIWNDFVITYECWNAGFMTRMFTVWIYPVNWSKTRPEKQAGRRKMFLDNIP